MWALTAGAGVFCVWWSFWPRERVHREPSAWAQRLGDRLTQAGMPAVTPAAVVATSVGLGLVVAVVVAATSSSPAIGIVLGAIASRGPFALVAARANARQSAVRRLWPDVVDGLSSAVRAGLSLPEAVGQVGERGPEGLREPFLLFAEDYRASGRFAECLDALKARLADPVGDRIVESLRITRDVGGTDLGTLLRTLSAFLREEASTRGELEARQSWTVNAARVAVSAPWAVILILSTQPANAAAYNTPGGVAVLVAGGLATIVAYRVMTRLGRLPAEPRVLR